MSSYCRAAAAVVLVFTVSAIEAQERKAFFGMLHSHTGLSDGEGTPEDAYDSAREAGLHFFALTEHNHSEAVGSDGVFLTPTNYNELKGVADAKTEDGHFVAIYGQEVSTISKGNHENVFFAPEIVNMPNGDFRFLYEHWMPDHPDAFLIQLNHPNTGSAHSKDYGIDDYGGDFADLVAACDRYVALIEVIKGKTETTSTASPHLNANYEEEYFFYLNKGFHVAPSVGGDEHRETWGKTMKARMGVWATELTRTGLEEAILGRHCYATEDDSISVQLTVNDMIMGSGVEITGPQSVSAKLSFDDASEADAKHRVQIFYDETPNGDKAQQVENILVAEGIKEASFTVDVEPGGYLFAKVVQLTPDGGSFHADDTWTAPVWFIGAGAPLIAAGTSPPPSPTAVAADTVISWEDAAQHVGQTITVMGRIIRVHNHDDRILFLNFSPNFRETLSLVIYRDNFDDFDPFSGVDALDERFMGKEVQIRGKITMYRNTQPQMVLNNQEQIISVEGE